jgi:hypothetical protein
MKRNELMMEGRLCPMELGRDADDNHLQQGVIRILLYSKDSARADGNAT